MCRGEVLVGKTPFPPQVNKWLVWQSSGRPPQLVFGLLPFRACLAGLRAYQPPSQLPEAATLQSVVTEEYTSRTRQKCWGNTSSTCRTQKPLQDEVLCGVECGMALL